MRQPSVRQRIVPRAFTLIELLIVIGILTILIAAALVVGTKVAGSGKQRVTEGIIKALDMSLSEYVHAAQHIPPPMVTDPGTQAMPNNGATKVMQPVADAVNMTYDNPPPFTLPAPPLINSVGLYMLQAKSVPGADEAIKSINTKFVRMYDPESPATGVGRTGWDHQPPLLTVFDGWGKPIRYVHPAFKGIIFSGTALAPQPKAVDQVIGNAGINAKFGMTQIRRLAYAPAAGSGQTQTAFPDADAGLPASNRPYFYSTGADGQAGYLYDSNQGYPPYVVPPQGDLNADNIFAGPVPPKYQKE